MLYRNWLRFMGMVIRVTPGTSFVTLLLTILVGLQPAAQFWALQGLIDAIIHGVSEQIVWTDIMAWLAFFAGMALLSQMAEGTFPYLTERIRQDAERAIEHELLEAAGSVPLLAMESSSFFDRFSRARQGMKTNIFGVVEGTQAITTHLLQIASSIVALAYANWVTAVLMLLLAIPVWALQFRVSNAYIENYYKQIERKRWSEYLGELLTHRRSAQEVRLFGLAGELLSRWRQYMHSVLQENLATTNRSGSVAVMASALGMLAFGAGVVFLLRSAVSGVLSIGGFAAAVRTTQQLQGTVLELAWRTSGIRTAGGFSTDLLEFVEEIRQTKSRTTSSAQTGPTEGFGLPVQLTGTGIVFDHVTFAYPGAATPALKNVSFTVAPGELIAIVGENGAGKSTLTKLLMGLYPSTEGTVSIFGHNPYGTEGEAIRPRVASVFQDFIRYSITAGENIGVGQVSAMMDLHRIQAAAAGSGAVDAILKLPKSYDTILGREWEAGTDLSGGQWQKLAIARGYMRQADILVLDEPTAALDARAELEVFERFQELVNEKTGFLISHRLGAARLADRIFVMRDGELMEKGTHDELIRQNGEYAALFAAQSKWYQS
jgi:ATP-binding cassette subfamily B protein